MAAQSCRCIGLISAWLVALTAAASINTAASAQAWNELSLPNYHCKVLMPWPGAVRFDLFSWTEKYQDNDYVVRPTPLAGRDGDQTTMEGIKRAFQKNKDTVSHDPFHWQVTSGQGWKGIRWQVASDTDTPRSGLYAVSDNNDYSYSLTLQGKAPAAVAEKFLQSLVVNPGQKWTVYKVPNEAWSVRIPASADQVKSMPPTKGLRCVEYIGATYAFGTDNESTDLLTALPPVLEQWQKEHGAEGLTTRETIGNGWFGTRWSTPTGVKPQRSGIYVVSQSPAYANRTFHLTVEGPATKEDVDLFLGSLTLINK